MEDTVGDASANAQTFPIRFGRLPALILITILYTALIVFTLVPYQLGIYNFAYLLAVVIGVDCILAGVLFILWFQRDNANLHLLSNVLKADMVLGLMAIYMGK